MVLKADQERIRILLKDTITLLCKNGLSFKTKFAIDAVIGVTVDESELFYLSMNEIVQSEKALLRERERQEATDAEHHRNELSQKRLASNMDHKRHRRKRPRIKQENSDVSSAEEDHGEFDHRSQSNTSPSSPAQGLHPQDDSRESDADDGNTNDNSRSFMQHVKNEITDGNDDDSGDIVFIKQELDDSWPTTASQQNTSNNHNQYYPDNSMPGSSGINSSMFASDNTQPRAGDQNFGSLSDMNLVPVAAQEGSMMWAQSSSYDSPARYRGPRMAPTSASSTGALDGAGDGQPQSADQQQVHDATPFCQTCDICNKTFASGWSCKRHRATHLGKFPFHCPYCNKGAYSKATLDGHISSKHLGGAKFYECSYCGKSYMYKASMEFHLKSHHTKSASLYPAKERSAVANADHE